MRRRAYRVAPTEDTTFHPRLIGRHGAVAANAYLSVNAGVDILKGGRQRDRREAGCDPRGAKAECFLAFAYAW